MNEGRRDLLNGQGVPRVDDPVAGRVGHEYIGDIRIVARGVHYDRHRPGRGAVILQQGDAREDSNMGRAGAEVHLDRGAALDCNRHRVGRRGVPWQVGLEAVAL